MAVRDGNNASSSQDNGQYCVVWINYIDFFGQIRFKSSLKKLISIYHPKEYPVSGFSSKVFFSLIYATKNFCLNVYNWNWLLQIWIKAVYTWACLQIWLLRGSKTARKSFYFKTQHFEHLKTINCFCEKFPYSFQRRIFLMEIFHLSHFIIDKLLL